MFSSVDILIFNGHLPDAERDWTFRSAYFILAGDKT